MEGGCDSLLAPASAGRAAGIALALLAASPMSIPLITDLPASPFLEVVADFGIFFLLLFAGLEMRPREIAAHSIGSLAVALGGVLGVSGRSRAAIGLLRGRNPIRL